MKILVSGFDPFGGRGKFANLFLSVIMLQVLQTGFTILNFSPFIKNLTWGAALIFVMIVNRLLEYKTSVNCKSSHDNKDNNISKK